MTFRPGSEIGRIGEDTACVFLMKQGFRIVDRNYWKKWGEIDVIAEKLGKLHFVEVKSVSRIDITDVSHETGHRPEENVHPAKVERLKRVIQTYLADNRLGTGHDWQFDIVAAYLNTETKQAKLIFYEDIIL